MIDWVSIITLLITFITGGGISALFFFKQERKSKELDNQGKNIDNAIKVVEKYESLVERYRTISDENQKKVEVLTKKVNDTDKKVAVMEAQLANVQMLYTSANAIKCTNINCPHRTPPLDKDYLDKIAGVDNEDNEYESTDE